MLTVDPYLILVLNLSCILIMFDWFQVPLVANSSLRTCIALLDSICIKV